MTGSTANQTLTINGSGFAPGAAVNLTYSGGTVLHPTIVSVTSTQIVVTVNAGTTARTWTVQVANSADQQFQRGQPDGNRACGAAGDCVAKSETR